MIKIISFIFMMFVALPSIASSYETLFIKNGTAKIKDRQNARILNVKEGDTLEDGWTVVAINENEILIEKWINEDERIQGILPARSTKSKGR